MKRKDLEKDIKK